MFKIRRKVILRGAKNIGAALLSKRLSKLTAPTENTDTIVHTVASNNLLSKGEINWTHVAPTGQGRSNHVEKILPNEISPDAAYGFVSLSGFKKPLGHQASRLRYAILKNVS